MSPTSETNSLFPILKRPFPLCGTLKYTHIVLEFWGMYKYDCLKELSWEQAFSKEEIRPLIQTANDLGMEIILMINHWGHASQCRQMYGKHTVLSQNPKLQYLFSDDGWRWNINTPKTKELLRKIRSELIELCGNGEYFMIGCDEADGFGFSESDLFSKNISLLFCVFLTVIILFSSSIHTEHACCISLSATF